MDVGSEASPACPVWGLWVGPRGDLVAPRAVWGLTHIYCLASGMQKGSR